MLKAFGYIKRVFKSVTFYVRIMFWATILYKYYRFSLSNVYQKNQRSNNLSHRCPFSSLDSYCMSKKSWPILCSELLLFFSFFLHSVLLLNNVLIESNVSSLNTKLLSLGLSVSMSLLPVSFHPLSINFFLYLEFIS